jgi:hypothetical protein
MMITSSTEPKIAQKIGKFQNHSGRRVVTSAPSGENKEESYRHRNKFSANANIEEIDKMLEADSITLINIKKEISASQNDELVKLQDSILAVKKEYDNYLLTNSMKEREYQALVDQYNTLTNLDKADSSTVEAAQAVMRSLRAQAAEVVDDLAAEQRTFKMQNLMIKRLDLEIGRCRLDTSKAIVSLDHAKHDMSLAETALQANRQDLIDQEVAFEKLTTTLKNRKDQRENKMNILNNISMEGESSALKLQTLLAENARVSLTAYRVLS